MKIEYINIDELKEYHRNARRHQSDDIEAIAASIRSFGFNDPLGIWKNNEIIEGHGRVMAARLLGMEKVPCIRLDKLTDEQRRAYALAHNRTAELSGWDFFVLDEELEQISDVDMKQFGFDTADDLEDFFSEKEKTEKEPKRIQCPVCGEWFEI